VVANSRKDACKLLDEFSDAEFPEIPYDGRAY
jgi:hypothetical protein